MGQEKGIQHDNQPRLRPHRTGRNEGKGYITIHVKEGSYNSSEVHQRKPRASEARKLLTGNTAWLENREKPVQGHSTAYVKDYEHKLNIIHCHDPQ